MARSWAHTTAGQWVGQVYCDRMRCDVKHAWPVTNPPTNRPLSYGAHRATDEQYAEYQRLSALATVELEEHPLPPGWVTVTLVDPDDISNRSRQFHSAHCAALWLDHHSRTAT